MESAAGSMSTLQDQGEDSDVHDDALAPTGPSHTNNEDSAAEESTAMLHHDDGNASSPRAQARSLDLFLEDAYREHGATSGCWRQWHYTIMMLSLGVANSSDASEILCISYIISNRVFQREMLLDADDNGDSDWRGGMLAASVFAGMLIGGLLVGTLGDWRGRRPMLLAGLMINMMAGLLSACAPSVLVLTMLRFFAGCGIGGTVPPLFTLVAELSPPSRRGFYVSVCASFWMVGSIFVSVFGMLILQPEDERGQNTSMYTTTDAGTANAFAAWRVLALVCAVPSALGALLVYALVPESPRFLAMQGKNGITGALNSANALATALQYTSGPPLQRWEVEEHYNPATYLTVAQQHPVIVPFEYGDSDGTERIHPPPWDFSTSTLGFVQLALVDFCTSASKLYTPQMLRTTLPLQVAWFSLSFGSYGLMTWINLLFFEVHLEDVYFNALLFAFSNLPGNLLTAYLMDRTGRSSLLVGSILSASASLLTFALFASSSSESTDPPNTVGIVLSACCFQCFTIMAWNTIDVMTSELFPTTVRSTGMGVCAASGRIGACIAQFINGALVGRPVRLLVVASITLALGAITPFILPSGGDMTGRPVQDDLNPNSTASSTREEGCREKTQGMKPSSQSQQPPSRGLSRRTGSRAGSPMSYQRLAVSTKGDHTIV